MWWWGLVFVIATSAEPGRSPLNCSAAPRSGVILDPFEQFLGRSGPSGWPGIPDFASYTTVCANPAIAPGSEGQCLAPLTGNATLYDAVNSVNLGGGDVYSTYNINCTQCNDGCFCPVTSMRGQVFGLCCGDDSGGVGCICPRRQTRICPDQTGENAGQCATTGFPTLPDASTPFGQTTLGMARHNGWTGLNAKTAFLGATTGKPEFVSNNDVSVIALNWFMGIPCQYNEQLPNPPACLASDTSPQAPALFMKYQQSFSPSTCISGNSQPFAILLYNSRLGQIISRNTIANANAAMIFRPTVYTSVSDNVHYLMPKPAIGAEGTPEGTLDIDPVDIATDFGSLYQGFLFTEFEGAGSFFEDNTLGFYYQVNNVSTSEFDTPTVPVGHIVQLAGSGVNSDCDFSFPSAGPILFYTPDTPIGSFATTQGTFLGQLDDISSLTHDITFLTTASTVIVPLWTFFAAAYVPQLGCTFVPLGIIGVVRMASIAGAGRSTELDVCRSNVGSQGACNGPITFTYIPSFQAIEVNINYNPSDTPVPLPPGSPPYYLTARFDMGSVVTIEAGNSDGTPTSLQNNWAFVPPSGVLNLDWAQLLYGVVWANSFCMYIPNNDNCALYFLANYPSGLCDMFMTFVPLTGPPVDLADCDTCTNCVCDSLSAERGDGSICCPAFSMGLNCTEGPGECIRSDAVTICSGNGNATYPGNVNGTGCYFNATTGAYACACLPEYIPPTCLFRYDTTCGRPMCNGRGNCTLDTNQINTAVCACENGYRGPQCEFPVVECTPRLDGPICSGHGRCEDPEDGGWATPLCICDVGYAGAFCEQPIADACNDVSTGTLCASRGVCQTNRRCPLPYPAVRPVRTCTNCSLAFNNVPGLSIISNTTVENQGPSLVVGDIGIPPDQLVTGFPPGTLDGTIVTDAGFSARVQSQVDILLALPCTVTLPLDDATDTELEGTLETGVYCFDPASQTVTIRTELVLDGQDDSAASFVFLIPQNFILTEGAQIALIRNARVNNVFFMAPDGTALVEPSATFMGILAATSVTLQSESAVAGLVTSLNGSVSLNAVEMVAPHVPTTDLACTAPPTAFDICNVSNPSAAGRAFCNSRIGLGKNIPITTSEYASQTFPIQVLQCMMNNHTIRRTFALMSYYMDYCIIEEEATKLFFRGASFDQVAATGDCSDAILPTYSQVRLWLNTALSYTFVARCYETAFILNNPSMTIQNAMFEALVTRVRVGTIVGTTRDDLLSLCQQFAKLTRSPFYGVSDSFNRCWLPSNALSAYPNYDYRADSDNAASRLFYVASTSSIPS